MEKVEHRGESPAKDITSPFERISKLFGKKDRGALSILTENGRIGLTKTVCRDLSRKEESQLISVFFDEYHGPFGDGKLLKCALNQDGAIGLDLLRDTYRTYERTTVDLKGLFPWLTAESSKTIEKTIVSSLADYLEDQAANYPQEH